MVALRERRAAARRTPALQCRRFAMDETRTGEIDPAETRAVSHCGQPQQRHTPARAAIFIAYDQMQVIRFVFYRDPASAATHRARIFVEALRRIVIHFHSRIVYKTPARAPYRRRERHVVVDLCARSAQAGIEANGMGPDRSYAIAHGRALVAVHTPRRPHAHELNDHRADSVHATARTRTRAL